MLGLRSNPETKMKYNACKYATEQSIIGKNPEE